MHVKNGESLNLKVSEQSLSYFNIQGVMLLRLFNNMNTFQKENLNGLQKCYKMLNLRKMD